MNTNTHPYEVVYFAINLLTCRRDQHHYTRWRPSILMPDMCQLRSSCLAALYKGMFLNKGLDQVTENKIEGCLPNEAIYQQIDVKL